MAFEEHQIADHDILFGNFGDVASRLPGNNISRLLEVLLQLRLRFCYLLIEPQQAHCDVERKLNDAKKELLISRSCGGDGNHDIEPNVKALA